MKVSSSSMIPSTVVLDLRSCASYCFAVAISNTHDALDDVRSRATLNLILVFRIMCCNCRQFGGQVFNEMSRCWHVGLAKTPNRLVMYALMYSGRSEIESLKEIQIVSCFVDDWRTIMYCLHRYFSLAVKHCYTTMTQRTNLWRKDLIFCFVRRFWRNWNPRCINESGIPCLMHSKNLSIRWM